MKLLKIGTTVINFDSVIHVQLEAPQPNWYPLDRTPAPIGVLVSFNAPNGSIGYADTGCGEISPAYLWFSGDEAGALCGWIENNCTVAIN